MIIIATVKAKLIIMFIRIIKTTVTIIITIMIIKTMQRLISPSWDYQHAKSSYSDEHLIMRSQTQNNVGDDSSKELD